MQGLEALAPGQGTLRIRDERFGLGLAALPVGQEPRVDRTSLEARAAPFELEPLFSAALVEIDLDRVPAAVEMDRAALLAHGVVAAVVDHELAVDAEVRAVVRAEVEGVIALGGRTQEAAEAETEGFLAMRGQAVDPSDDLGSHRLLAGEGPRGTVWVALEGLAHQTRHLRPGDGIGAHFAGEQVGGDPARLAALERERGHAPRGQHRERIAQETGQSRVGELGAHVVEPAAGIGTRRTGLDSGFEEPERPFEIPGFLQRRVAGDATDAVIELAAGFELEGIGIGCSFFVERAARGQEVHQVFHRFGALGRGQARQQIRHARAGLDRAWIL